MEFDSYKNYIDKNVSDGQFNKLSSAEAERLALLLEELGDRQSLLGRRIL